MVKDGPLVRQGKLLGPLAPRANSWPCWSPEQLRVAFPWIECLFQYIHQMLYLCYVAVTGVHGHPTYQKPQAIGLFLKAFVITFTSKSWEVDLDLLVSLKALPSYSPHWFDWRGLPAWRVGSKILPSLHTLGETRLSELLFGILAAKQPWKLSSHSLLLVSLLDLAMWPAPKGTPWFFHFSNDGGAKYAIRRQKC